MVIEQLPAKGGLRPDRATGIGQWLFRHRSLTPVPFIALGLAFILGSGSGASHIPPTPDHTLRLLAPALVLAGCMVRWSVIGSVPRGACGRGRTLHTPVLVTWGWYAHTRNPLYFGNLLICTGIALDVRSLPIALAAGLFFALQYGPIILAEESYLRDRFGEAYEGWKARVPRFWPKWRSDNPPHQQVARTLSDGSKQQKVSPDPSSPGRHRWSNPLESDNPMTQKEAQNRQEPETRRWAHALQQDADTWFAGLGCLLAWRCWLNISPFPGGGDPASWLGALFGAYLAVKMASKLRKLRSRR